jgi:aspartate carbamoyltransferase catalytic subunit
MNNFPSVLEAISDLNIDQIEGLLILSKKFKERPSDSTIFTNHRPIVANSFLEYSTRTKHSFAISITKLGCRYLDFNAETSSLKKGESLSETLKTLSCQNVDLCVIRSSESNILSQFKELPPLKIINGGDGINQHPTQALLDLFTLTELTDDLNGKTLGIIGDCLHSRVGNSLCQLLPLFGCKIVLIGPKEFLPTKVPNDNVSLSSDLDSEITNLDFIYSLRIQKERHKNLNQDLYNEFVKKFSVTLEKLTKFKKLIPVLHPGPVNVGVELDQELLDSPCYKGYLQVRNSIYMRMAIITAMLQNNDKIVGKFHESIQQD